MKIGAPAALRQSLLQFGVGFVFGLLAAFSIATPLLRDPAFLGVGVFSAAAVLVGLLVSLGLHGLRQRGRRAVASAGLIILAWPISFVAVWMGAALLDRLTYGSLSLAVPFSVGLALGAITGGLLVGLAAFLFTGRWLTRGAVALSAAGLITVALAYPVFLLAGHVGPTEFRGETTNQLFWGILLPVGMGLYTALFGYWVRQTEAAG